MLLLSTQGLSFLDLRYHLLLFYLQDLTHLISIKTEGGKFTHSEALNRIVTVRTVCQNAPDETCTALNAALRDPSLTFRSWRRCDLLITN